MFIRRHILSGSDKCRHRRVARDIHREAMNVESRDRLCVFDKCLPVSKLYDVVC
jgi:hypothetical protein